MDFVQNVKMYHPQSRKRRIELFSISPSLFLRFRLKIYFSVEWYGETEIRDHACQSALSHM
jgi:hypothetical protein